MDRPHRRREETPAATNQQLDLFALLEPAPAAMNGIREGARESATSTATPSEVATSAAEMAAVSEPALATAVNAQPHPCSPEDPFAARLASCTTLDEVALLAHQCQRCRLRAGCRQVVFGEGDSHAELMVIGEAPGATEDELGRPFVGRAGQLLDKMLAATGFTRGEVYITNTVKCRPPGNRVPAPDERDICFPYLRAQIETIRPRMILCLGSPSLQTMVGPTARITRDHGRWFTWMDTPVMATFHPAALLRDPSKKLLAWQDLLELRRRFLELGGHLRGLHGAAGGEIGEEAEPGTAEADRRSR